jgi:hypothetical protein
VLQKSLHVSREAPLSRAAERFKSSIGIHGFKQPWLETESVRNQRRSEAVADIQPEISSTLFETLPLFAIRDASEDVKVSVLSGSDQNWSVPIAPKLLDEVMNGRGVFGTVAVDGEDIVSDLHGERGVPHDRGVDGDPPGAVVVRIDQQRVAAGLHDREREAAAVLEELCMVAVSSSRVLRLARRIRRGG